MHAGKSTLLERLSKQKCIGLVPEVAREVIEANPEIETKPEFQDLLFDEQFKR